MTYIHIKRRQHKSVGMQIFETNVTGYTLRRAYHSKWWDRMACDIGISLRDSPAIQVIVYKQQVKEYNAEAISSSTERIGLNYYNAYCVFTRRTRRLPCSSHGPMSLAQ